MPGITGHHHVAICVTDLERSKRFYEDVLGLTPIARPAFTVAGAWYELGDGTQLHLIVHRHPRTLRGTRDVDILDGHFAFRIRDYDQAVAHLRAHGVEPYELPDNVTPWKQLYFTDPDGNEIELNVDRSTAPAGAGDPL
jgi:catechol 2,3-dioxygenase-like lactoylglutathione lyase family enzyme